MTEKEEESLIIVKDDAKTEHITEKEGEKTDVISVEDLFEKDITFRDLPEAVKEYFQQYLNKIPKNVAGQKSEIEIVQRLKNIFQVAYLRDVLFEHIVKVKESYKDKENPEDWVRQINPSIFTKFKQFVDTESNEMLELFDTAGMDDDYDKIQKVTMTSIMKERKMIKKKDEPKEEVLVAEYEVIKDE
jgi:hypothetical protein